MSTDSQWNSHSSRHTFSVLSCEELETRSVFELYLADCDFQSEIRIILFPPDICLSKSTEMVVLERVAINIQIFDWDVTLSVDEVFQYYLSFLNLAEG